MRATLLCPLLLASVLVTSCGGGGGDGGGGAGAGNAALKVVASSDAVNGDIFTITWQFPAAYQYDLWLYVGGGIQWQHVVGTTEENDRGAPIVAANRVGASYCFQMTAVDRGVGSSTWPPSGTVRYQASSGNKAPC